MIKIVITGGDNCYCCECGGVCDRLIMEEDTTAKTLRYIDGKGVCLGKYCWCGHECDDGTELTKWRDGVRAWRGGANIAGNEVKCVVRNNKWGKDGEYGTRGTSICASTEEWKSGRVALMDWKSADAEREYWAQYDRADYNEYRANGWKDMREFMTPTGWTLITK